LRRCIRVSTVGLAMIGRFTEGFLIRRLQSIFKKMGRLTPARMRNLSRAITNANGADGGVAAR
jgi:hypothetical protein